MREVTVHSEIRWVKPVELGDYDFAPADVPFVERLKGFRI